MENQSGMNEGGSKHITRREERCGGSAKNAQLCAQAACGVLRQKVSAGGDDRCNLHTEYGVQRRKVSRVGEDGCKLRKTRCIYTLSAM